VVAEGQLQLYHKSPDRALVQPDSRNPPIINLPGMAVMETLGDTIREKRAYYVKL